MRYIYPIFFLALVLAPELQAQGDLSVVPRRVIFDNGSKRAETLYLTNRGQDTATYNLSFVNYKVEDNGEFDVVSEDSAVNPASNNLRFYPRRITLAPNQTQTVKLQLRGFSNLNEGEYRSHLLFRGVPDNNARSSFNEAENPDSVGIVLKAIYGLTIPNIIRKGDNTTAATIKDINLETLENGSRLLSFSIFKEGNMSIYGAVSIDYLKGDGSLTNLGVIPGLAIYADNDRRDVRLPLSEEFTNVDKGNIQITLTSKEEKSVNDIIAEGVLKL